MKILVTGSNGFLGSYLRHNNSFQDSELIWGTTSSDAPFKGLRFEKCYRNMKRTLEGMCVDAIIHFASAIPSSFAGATYEEVFLPNVEMMRNLCDYVMESSSVSNFVNISGFGSMRTPALLDVRDYYTLSKVTCELFCKMLEAKGVAASSLRVSSPYGEYSRARNVINIFLEQALSGNPMNVYGTGSREQNFTYAGDLVSAIEACLEKKASGVYEIVAERNTTMLELAETIKRVSGSKSAIVVGEKPDPQEDYKPRYDFKRAHEDLSYSPKYTLENGLARYLAWLAAQRPGKGAA